MQYYNGILFAGYLEGLPRTVLAGGRYDSMMHKIGKQADAIGFALYLDELSRLASPPKKYGVDAVVLYKETDDYVQLLQAVDSLRAKGLKVRTCLLYTSGEYDFPVGTDIDKKSGMVGFIYFTS